MDKESECGSSSASRGPLREGNLFGQSAPAPFFYLMLLLPHFPLQAKPGLFLLFGLPNAGPVWARWY